MKIKISYLIIIPITIIIGLEIFLRFVISMPSTQQYDSKLGYTNIPYSEFIESHEGYSKTTFNSLGFNDFEPDDKLDRKIFVIGDSYTEAFQVDKSVSFTSILENLISDQSTDVIKLARDSFMPFHYPVLSDRYYDRFKPEVTIVQFASHTVSDLYEDNVKLIIDNKGNISDYTIQASSSDQSKESIRKIINNSALAYYVLKKYKYLIVQTLDRVKSIVSSNADKKPAIKRISKKDMPDTDHIKRISYVISKIKGPVICMYLPAPSITFEESQQNNRIRDIVKEASLQSDAAFLDFSDIFRQYYSTYNKTLNGFSNSKPGSGHLNYRGHELVARNLHIQLSKMGYIK